MGRYIGLKEHQRLMLDILSSFADFCDKHSLNYYLDAGTLLGAVRHRGFIPWDNDIDVCMTKPDFDVFLSIIEKTSFKLNNFLVLEKPENTIYTFYKICDTRTKLIEYPDGVTPFEYYVYIDLFVKVGLPNNSRIAKRICKKSENLALWHWFYKRTIRKWLSSRNLLKKIIGLTVNTIIKDKNRAYYKQKKFIEKVSFKYPYYSCDYVTTLTNGEYYRRCRRDFFSSFTMLEFEGKYFKCPYFYDRWLKVLYGDNYMELPPKDKQEVHNVVVNLEE